MEQLGEVNDAQKLMNVLKSIGRWMKNRANSENCFWRTMDPCTISSVRGAIACMPM